MNGRKIRSAVITGATGMIGAALTEALIRSGIHVYALVRPGSRKLQQLPSGSPLLTVIPCELSALSVLPEVPADAFFHLGWGGTIGPDRSNEQLQRENVSYALDALMKAKACGASVFVFSGSQAEFGPKTGVLSEETPCAPATAYGKAKLEAEEKTRTLAAKLGIAHTAVRILSVYGPGDNPETMIMQGIRTLCAGGRPAFTAGEQQWDYLYAEDAAEALKRLAFYGKEGGTYVLGSGEARPLKDYIYMLRDAVAPGAALGIGEIPYAPGQVMFLQADITKLKKDTGFSPAVPFEEGIRRTAQWYRERYL